MRPPTSGYGATAYYTYHPPLILLAHYRYDAKRGLLTLALDLGQRLLPALQTESGIPFGSINLRRGVSPTETPVTCTAAAGTLLLEFGLLSRLTGDRSLEAQG